MNHSTQKAALRMAAALLLLAMAAGSALATAPASGAGAESAAYVEGINVAGLPLVEEMQTIQIATRINDGEPSNADLRFWRELEEKTNVHAAWVEVLYSAWSEKKNVMAAANDQPDVYLGGMFDNNDLLSLGANGRFIPIQAYIDPYMPVLSAYFAKYPEWKTAATAPDGNIYAVPNIMEVGGGSFSYAYTPFINQGWIDKVELSFEFDANTPVTAEQFAEILTAFKTQDPNGNGKADEIPWSPMNVNSLYDWGASFGVIEKSVFVKGNQVVWAAMQPEFKAFVGWLNGLWSKGLMDPESFTQNDAMYNAKLKNPDDIVGYTSNWRLGSTQYSGDDARFVSTVPLKASDDYDPAWPKQADFSIARGGFIVTSAAKNPALCLRWADVLCEPENSLQINSAQLIGEHLEKEADGTYRSLRAIDWNREGERLLMPGNRSKLYIVTKDIWSKQQNLPPVSVQKDPVDAQYAAYEPKGMTKYPSDSVWMAAEDAKKINIILSEITPYIDSSFANWVTSGGMDSEWDYFLSTMEKMGADEAAAIYQKYYDQGQ